MIQVRHLVIAWGGGTNAALYYHPLTPTQKTQTTTASSATCEAPAAGTIRNLAVTLVAAVGGGDAITIAFNKNGSASGITCTVTDPAKFWIWTRALGCTVTVVSVPCAHAVSGMTATTSASNDDPDQREMSRVPLMSARW